MYECMYEVNKRGRERGMDMDKGSYRETTLSCHTGEGCLYLPYIDHYNIIMKVKGGFMYEQDTNLSITYMPSLKTKDETVTSFSHGVRKVFNHQGHGSQSKK